MKNKSLITRLFVPMAVCAVIAGGCGKIDDFGNTNSNPNAVTAPVPSALLSNALSILDGMSTPLAASLYCQYISENQYTETSTFAFQNPSSNPIYSGNPYDATIPKRKTGSMMDLQVIINLNSNPATQGAASAFGSNANQIAVAKIAKAYMMWVVTDRYGDMPYSEALLGAANPSPKYDKQLDIYKTLISELTAAVAGFDNGDAVKGDIVYGGNSTKWKKFANTMRMMMALRLSKRFPNTGEYAQVEFAKAASSAAGFITSNDDNFTLVPNGGVFANPWYETYDGAQRDDYGISKTMTDCLGGLGDSRIAAFSTHPNGFPYGIDRTIAVNFGNANTYGRVIALSKRTSTSPTVMISAAASLLAQAEGIERGWITGNAQAVYESGVAASFAQWGVTMPGTYLTGSANYNSGAGVNAIGQSAPPYDAIPAAQGAPTPTKLSRIQLQRWLASFPNGNEGWAEWRRTGVPNLLPTRFATNAADGKVIPRRFAYSTNEASLNPAKLAEAIAGLTGGDKQSSKVWWDN